MLTTTLRSRSKPAADLDQIDEVAGVLARGYPRCHGIVTDRLGTARWRAVAQEFFFTYLVRHLQQGRYADRFPEFLDGWPPSARAVPAWLADLADLELWSRLTRESSPSAQDLEPDAGPLRLGSTVELRAYWHDLPAWLEGRPDPGRSDAPTHGRVVVMFWQDRRFALRREKVDQASVAVVRAVRSGRQVVVPEAKRILEVLRALGAVLGREEGA